MVPPAGFEPAVSALKGRRPKPLDDGDTYKAVTLCHKRERTRRKIVKAYILLISDETLAYQSCQVGGQ